MPEPSYTPFAGLIRIPPAQSIAANGFEFQYIDPLIVDRLLQLGAVLHKHDGEAALASPGPAPTLAVSPVGGSIPGGETVEACYTLVDDDGGETLPSAIATKETAATGTDPAKAPSAALNTAAGVLLAGTYTYGVTITDGAGGESILSPLVEVLVEPGFAHARVELGQLKKILEETGGKEWRLWRQQGGGLWNLIAQGTTEEKIDDGTLVPDCTVEPPIVSTTHGTASVTLTVPNPAEPRALFFRLYATTDGTFGPVSLLGEYPAAEFGKALVFGSLATAVGQPPPVTRAYPHADKINPETDLLNWHWRAPVGKASELPSEHNEAGDVRLVLETFQLYTWDGVGKKWVGLTAKTMVTTHFFALRGPVSLEPPLPPYEPELAAGQSIHLIAVRYSLLAGVSLSFHVQRNGVDVPGLGTAGEPLVAKTVAKRTAATEGGPALASGDRLVPILSAEAGAPEGAAIGLVLAHTV